jgi:hypothetical protein
MSKATSYLILLAVGLMLIQSGTVFAFSANHDPSLVAFWKMDETAGTIAADSSGHGNDGTLTNGPTWVAGYLKGALQLDGTDDYVECGNDASLNMTSQITLAAWIKPNAAGNGQHQHYVTKGDMCYALKHNQSNYMEFNIYDGTWYTARGPAVTSAFNGTWHHVAGTYDGTTLRIYVDGELQPTYGAESHVGVIANTATSVSIGRDNDSGGRRYYNGLIDDVRIYDRALSDAEILAVMKGAENGPATSPSPKDKTTDVPREVVMSWEPGPFAATHDVYMGTSFDDVNTASTDSPLLVSSGQDANSYDPPVRLDFDTTYYWRVDEVNAPPSTAVFKGEVWSFTTEPLAYKVATIAATASSGSATSPAVNTVNGSGLVDDAHGTDPKTMWLGTALPAWIQYDFDRVYKVYEMWVWNHNTSFESILGLGVKNAAIEYSSDGTNWTSLGDFEFAQATGDDDYAHNTTVPFGGVPAKSVRIAISSSWKSTKQTGLSEVRFYYIPVAAREPNPATGSTGINPTSVVFSWRAGREAVSHDVYVGADANAVAASTTPAGTSSTASYKPSGLELDGTYYWRVDEVNTAETYTTWASPVWNFTTGSFVVVDGMESYNDTTNKIFDIWADGYGTTTNGSQVGYDQSADSTFGNTTTVHGGKQSMPFSYGKNGISTSEATLTFDTAQDWSAAGIKTLVLYFYGDPANSAAQLYVKINSAKVMYSGDAINIQRHRWNQWNIDLASISGGVKAVKTLTIGVSGSGTGTLLIDDIRLYKNAPAVPTPVDPGTSNLVAYYAMSNNVQDSSGKGNNGTVVGTPTYEAGLSASNMALRLNGTTDCVDLGNKAVWNPTGSFSVSLWANIGLWSTAWNHVMIGNRGEDNVGWQIRRYSGENLCFTTRGVGNDDMASVITPPLNEWIHITCVYDNAANTKTIYINGVQDSVVTTTVGAHITATTHNTYIGARATSGNTGPDTTTFFTGLLDEIRVYNRALTAGEADFLSKP